MLHKRVTTENHSNSWAEFGTQKARIQRRRNCNLRRSLCISVGSIGSFACGLQKKANTHAGAYAHAVKHGKAAYLEIYANLQQGKTYFPITTKEGVQHYVDFRKRDVELGHIASGRLATTAAHLQHWLSFISKEDD